MQVQGRGEPSGERLQVLEPAAQGSGDGVRAGASVLLRDGEEPPGERDTARAPPKRPRRAPDLMIPTLFTTTSTTYHQLAY